MLGALHLLDAVVGFQAQAAFLAGLCKGQRSQLVNNFMKLKRSECFLVHNLPP